MAGAKIEVVVPKVNETAILGVKPKNKVEAAKEKAEVIKAKAEAAKEKVEAANNKAKTAKVKAKAAKKEENAPVSDLAQTRPAPEGTCGTKEVVLNIVPVEDAKSAPKKGKKNSKTSGSPGDNKLTL